MIKPLLLAAAALALTTGPALAQQDLSRPDSSFQSKDNPGNWQTTIARTDRGHLIGDPKADTKLVEFISYTCPHCADFAARGEPALELVLLMPGKISLEVRPVIRNALDITISLLVQCGDPAGSGPGTGARHAKRQQSHAQRRRHVQRQIRPVCREGVAVQHGIDEAPVGLLRQRAPEAYRRGGPEIRPPRRTGRIGRVRAEQEDVVVAPERRPQRRHPEGERRDAQ